MEPRIIQDLTHLRNMLSSNSQNLRTNRELYNYVTERNLDATADGRNLLGNYVRNVTDTIDERERADAINRIDMLLEEARGDGMIVLRRRR